MNRRTPLLLVAAFAFAFLLAPATPALANSTEGSWQYDDFHSVFRHWCDFPVKFTAVGAFKRTDFYDDAGTLYKTTLRPGHGLYVYGLSANGTTLQAISGYSAILTYNSDGQIATYTETGQVFTFTVPGGGVVLLRAGRLVLDWDTGDVLSQTGPHAEDYTKLCAALA